MTSEQRRAATSSAAATQESNTAQSTLVPLEGLGADDENLANGALSFTNLDSLAFSGTSSQGMSVEKPRSIDFALDEGFVFDESPLNQYQQAIDASLFSQQSSDQRFESWCTWTQGKVSLAVVTQGSPPRSSLNLAAAALPHAQHNADLIIQSLRALPTMMLRRETFPWFIHPRSHPLANCLDTGLPEALSNCMSIAQMFASRTTETKHFLRQTIGVEYRRFLAEVLPSVLAGLVVC